MADLIISQPMTFTVDVKNGLVERPQRESLMRGDKMANRIIAELVYGSEPFDITGVTVKGKFCRPPSGDEIDLVGEAKGNVAEVQLTDQCYTSGGHYEARVILVLGGVERTVLFISGDVLKSGSGNAAGDEETGGSGGSTGSGLPAGGTAGQVLVKVSSAQGDAIWKTLTAADVGALPSDGTAVNANALNGKDVKYYLSARNLLDNSDFRNPVNQRGQTSYNRSSYGIDRWAGNNANLQVDVIDDTGISLSNNDSASNVAIYQRIEQSLIGKTLTFAVCTTDDKVYCGSTVYTESTGIDVVFTVEGVFQGEVVTSGGYTAVRILLYPQAAVSLKWAALYEGEYTVNNLPPYVSKGYAAELSACKRCYKSYDGMLVSGVMLYDGATFAASVDLHDMRVVPSIDNYQLAWIYLGKEYKLGDTTITVVSKGRINITTSDVTSPSGETTPANVPGVAYFTKAGFSADL